MEIRTEDDPDIRPYVHTKIIEQVTCKPGLEGGKVVIKSAINDLMKPFAARLCVPMSGTDGSWLNSSHVNTLNMLVINELIM